MLAWPDGVGVIVLKKYLNIFLVERCKTEAQWSTEKKINTYIVKYLLNTLEVSYSNVVYSFQTKATKSVFFLLLGSILFKTLCAQGIVFFNYFNTI